MLDTPDLGINEVAVPRVHIAVHRLQLHEGWFGAGALSGV